MTTLEDWGVPLAVLGMLMATLFMAAVAKRYQAHQALVRAQVRRLATGIADIVTALDAVRSVPLSRELRVTLRSDVVVRYRRIRQLYRRYPDISARLQDAEARLQAEGAPVASGVGPIENEQAFRQLIGAIDTLSALVGNGETLQPVPRDVRQIFCRELGERRAEANARFHLTQSQVEARAGNLARGRAHLTTLLQVLKRRGPSTDFVRELYAEAEQAYTRLSAPPPAAAEDGTESAA